MALEIKNERPCPGLHVSTVQDEKFNVEAVVVRFITPLDELHSQRITMLVSLLCDSNARFPEKAQLAKKLASLYGASLHSFSYRTGNYLVAGLAVNSIADRFAIDGENVTEECAKLLLDCIFEPDIRNGEFDKQYFEQKRRELIEKIRSASDNRHTYAISRARDISFAGEAAAVTVLGTEENARAVTSDDIFASYRDLLDNSFISISFCGGGTNTAAQKLVRDRFLSLCSDRKCSLDIADMNAFSPLRDKPQYITERIEQAQSKLVMFFKNGGGELYAAKLACAMFGATPFSKLFSNVREKLSLCYYCRSAIVECKGAMLVDCGVEPGDEQKACDEILRQLELLRSGDFSDEELSDTKRYLSGGFRSNYDSFEDLNSWYFIQFARGTLDSPQQAAAKLEALSREDVINAAKNFSLDTVYMLLPSGGEEDA